MRLFVSILLSLFVLPGISFGQEPNEPITLINPSFEDIPRYGKPPRGWYDCGFPGETPPDVQPLPEGQFQVSKPAEDGDTYLGLVVRDNETWEMVSQRLSAPLKAGKCYQFSLFLCRSNLYVSQSRTTDEEVNYTTPAKLRIWGGAGYCNKAELLAETSQIINTRWLEYNFKFEPKQTHTYLMLEVFYKTPVLFPYNGNVLVDNASPIIPVPCDIETPESPALAENATAEEPPTPSPSKPQPPQNPPRPAAENTLKPLPPTNQNKPKILKSLERNRLRKGQTIRIDKLYFEADKATFTPDSYAVLDEIYYFLSANKDVMVEIGGHTNTIPEQDYCDRLSKARAKGVVDYLVAKGIDAKRLAYKGYGKRKPIIRNDKYSQAARKKNQRVEIKILGFEG